MSKTTIRVADSLHDISDQQWDALVAGNPTLKHAWLQALIDASCTTAATGWLPQFILLSREIDGVTTLVGAVPLYMKNHSYGEYVFDWAWAEAYARAGMDYYPKLLCAIPFTPCSGARILALNATDQAILIDVRRPDEYTGELGHAAGTRFRSPHARLSRSPPRRRH